MKFNRSIKKIGGQFFLALFLLTSLSHASPIRDCEEVSLNKTPVFSKKFHASEVTELVNDYLYNGHTLKKAKGLAGEYMTEFVFENDLRFGRVRYTSLESLLGNKGCALKKTLRDGADRGIDHIFVVKDGRNGKVNPRYNPIFVEAKYRKNCYVPGSTIKTKTSCSQLSARWLGKHIRGVYKRGKLVTSRKDIRFGFCDAASRATFSQTMNWLSEKVQQGHMSRYVSLLCPDGDFNLYEVNR